MRSVAGSRLARRPTPPPTTAANPVPTLRAVTGPLLTLLANVAVLTALLVYFGWQRTESEAAALGIDESVLGLGTQDYVLRSVGPVLRLLAVVGVSGYLAVRLDSWTRGRIEARPETDRLLDVLTLLMLWSWLVLPLAVVALSFRVWAVAYVAFPFAIGLGALLVPYARVLRARRGLGGEPPPGDRAAERLLSVLVLAVTLFWGTSNYAELVGEGIADRIRTGAAAATPAAVYSPHPLEIAGAGVVVERFPGPTYGYRYTGLRLLERSTEGYVLLAGDWSTDDAAGVVVILPSGAPLRFEFGPGARPVS
ncbi:hypothetical protein [Kineosporia sp. R_H_3]|uniref:hypothetical protein n=1 Tax=Kineosporia sp. R_H_3 TaxID=1961848 RepID=UPI00117BC0E0|nr:hypothetical protein [Kineosporia sp. R_H_3]